MIPEDKFENALYALQELLIFARSMAYAKKPYKEIADILDTAEYLPYLIMNDKDETERFRMHLQNMADKYGCYNCLENFDDLIKFEKGSKYRNEHKGEQGKK